MTRKKAIEEEFTNWVNANPDKKKMYGEALTLLKDGYSELKQYKLPETYFTEAAVGSEAMLFAFKANRMLAKAIENPEGDEWEGTKAGLLGMAQGHFKDYNIKTDKKVTARMMEMYANEISPEFHPAAFAKSKGDWKKWVEKKLCEISFH